MKTRLTELTIYHHDNPSKFVQLVDHTDHESVVIDPVDFRFLAELFARLANLRDAAKAGDRT